VVWNRYGVGLQSCRSGKKVKPRVSGEKRAEDVLPSWRSVQSLAVKETALGLRSGSLASKRRNLDMMVSLKSVGVKENRTTLLCKKSGGDAEICEVEDQDAARYGNATLALVR